MISASTTAKNILEQNISIREGVGCLIEYNMNQLVESISVSGNDYVKSDGTKPFNKLFPASSIVKPFRPASAGIKYAITGDVASGSYQNPSSTTYPLNYRTYYPGADTYYKYWVSPKGVGADISITYPIAILTNKIVVKFEISHSVPSTWTVYANSSQIATGTSSSIKPFGSGYDDGSLTIYYNGTSWTTTEPASPASPVSVSSLRLTTSAASNAYIGVTEFSPRWYIDISDYIQGFNISKESSTSADDILPVGRISANSLSIDFISYESSRKMLSYTKGTAFDSSKIYLYKQVELKPYYKLYHASGSSSDSKGAYERINQGTFYIDNWSTSEFGDISVTGLDGAKILQEIICPGIVCENYSAAAIIRRLLDNVGFTNYNINTATSDSSVFSPKFWWSDDTKTVWDTIQEIARDSQMTAVFDENNVLQFYTRDYLFNSSKATDFTLRYDQDGSNLPNIISLSKNDLATANQVKVLWNSVTKNDFDGNSQPLWKSDVTFIGAYSLEEDLAAETTTGGYIKLAAVDVNQYLNQIQYSFSGYLVIDSEIIEYDAVQYSYINKSGTRVDVDVTSVADIQKFQGDISTAYPITQTLMQSGKIRIKQRGAFGTGPNGTTGTGVSHVTNRNNVTTNWAGKNIIFKPSSDSTVVPSSSSASISAVTTTPTLLTTPDTTVSDVKKVQRSLLQLTCNSTNENLYSAAIRDTGISTSGDYYLFGTSTFFQSSVKDVLAAGGFGFFTSNDGLDGYYVIIQTTSNVTTGTKQKEIQIFKSVDGLLSKLTDSQTTDANTLNYVAGGTPYKVDLRVDTSGSSTVIDLYINGFKISAADGENLIAPTSNIAVLSATGSSFYDYAYAMPVTKEQYSAGPLGDIYSGQFGSIKLDFLYGDRVVNNLGQSSLPQGFVEEFGTVAREMRKVTVKYDARPGFPLLTSLGINKYIKILGSRLTSYGAEVYVLNNAGTFMPLDDSQLASFSIIGNAIVQTGQQEYVESSVNEFTAPEPVVFQSTWIQSEADAKSLAQWIKNQWSKKQVVCSLNIFANPLISVGDVVTINYAKNGFDGTQKFIVVSVNNSFGQGVETSIVARSIYS